MIHSTVIRTIPARRRRVLSRPHVAQRNRVLASFQALAHGVEATAAHVRSTAFYRAGGTAWARVLG